MGRRHDLIPRVLITIWLPKQLIPFAVSHSQQSARMEVECSAVPLVCAAAPPYFLLLSLTPLPSKKNKIGQKGKKLGCRNMIFIMIRLCACFFMYLNTKLILSYSQTVVQFSKSIAKEIS